MWQRAHQVTLTVYALTRTFPADERYGVTSQLRRAASSIAANIAEGCGRNGEAELARFLTIALGSLAETLYFVILARDLNYLSPEQSDSLQQELVTLRKMLIAFSRRVKPYAPKPQGS